MNLMANAEEIISQICAVTEFYEDFDATKLAYDPETAFTTVHEQVAIDGIVRYLGFGVPIGTDGAVDRRRLIVPITRLEDVHPSRRNIDTQGKGVGPRLYNWPEATLKRPEDIGAFVVDVPRDKILDYEAAQGDRVDQFLSHLKRIRASRREGLGTTVERIHESYGSAPVVRLKQPVKPATLQRLTNRANPEGMIAAFFIIRDSSIVLRRVGDYRPYGKTASAGRPEFLLV